MAKTRVAPPPQTAESPETRAHGSAGCRETGTFRAEHIKTGDSLPYVLELSWLGLTNRWKPFICNQMEEIQQLVEPALWKHCPRNDNTADFLSRGLNVGGLATETRCWRGRSWLADFPRTWPCDVGDPGRVAQL
ncbi:hypothetical protein T11_14617 [Trichinella zimbabwensis]|uniref:Uncharacterized protein n=1 Tax=Trichinella zimbabwensis TaxID=268475 RepID=A0A0V1HM09_9BILA|nr:hypothetical protein T11_14617 [Trichinella zimbabwensis]